MTFTGLIGKICMFPLRAIIGACVALKIHPNILTFVGVLINTWAAVHLAKGQFIMAGVIMIVANIFDFIDGKVAVELGRGQQVRRLLGLGDRPLLRHRAVHRSHLPLLRATAGPITR